MEVLTAHGMQEGQDVVSSCLTGAKRGMKRAVLEVIATKAVVYAADVKRYIKCTLLAATTDFEVDNSVSTHGLRLLGPNAVCFSSA